ncbi:MAG TPA: VWA domain-containing protein, partial [Planctomycetota bacterium]|nr:VWA domain-containing protein [Planctomycetota bacterium]
MTPPGTSPPEYAWPLVWQLHGVVPWLAAGAALALVVGLLRARAGSAVVRLPVLVAAALLLAAALDPRLPETVLTTPATRWIATGSVSPALREALERAAGSGTVVEEVGDDPGALAVALRARDGAAHPALLWVAPIAGEGAPAGADLDVAVFGAVAPLGFDPDRVELRAAGVPRAGRPLALELVGLPEDWTAQVEVTGPDGGPLPAAQEPAGTGLRIEVVPERAGPHSVRVEARAGGRTFAASGICDVPPPPPVLVVGAEGDPVAAALEAQGFAVERAAELPADLARFASVVAGRTLRADEQRALLAYAADGGGVLLLGSPAGGALPIEGEPAAVLSPVVLAARPTPAASGEEAGEDATGEATGPPTDAEVDPLPARREPDPAQSGDATGAKLQPGPEREVERRFVAMAFVIDRSQSMLEREGPAGQTRMDYVLAAAQGTASRLLPGDQIAIVTFGNRDAEEVALPLTDATAFARVHGAFAGLAARRNEGTYVVSALERVRTLLAGSQAAVKHAIVITDGVIQDLTLAMPRVRALREAGVTVSMIRFGAGPEELMVDLSCRRFAELGGGKYLHSTDTSEVPALVSTEVKRVVGRGDHTAAAEPGAGAGDAKSDEVAPREPEKQPEAPPPPPDAPRPPAMLRVRAVDDSALLASLPRDAIPPLGGILPVSARPNAHVLLVAGDDGRPVLAFTNYGLGRVGAWTADLAGGWSAAWRAAPEFPAWVAQWVASLA